MLTTDKLEILYNQFPNQKEAIDQIVNSFWQYLLPFSFEVPLDNMPDKQNLLVVGDTGTGKTFLVTEVCKLFNVPFIELNAPSINKEGWAGTSLQRLLYNAVTRKEIKANQPAIILLDEFDKACLPLSSSDTHNYNAHLQYEWLKLISGTTINYQDLVIDTRYFYFIFCGNFKHLRQKEKQNIGFSHNALEQKPIYEKLIELGMISEMAGRIGRIVELPLLTAEMLKLALTSRNGLLAKWQRIFEKSGKLFELNIDDVVKTAMKNSQLGYRSLQQPVFALLDAHINKHKEFLLNYQKYLSQEKYMQKLRDYGSINQNSNLKA